MLHKKPGMIALLALARKENPIKPKVEMPELEDNEDFDGANILAEDILSAIESKSAESLASAIRALKEYCSEDDSMED